MIDHTGIGVADVGRSVPFYDAALGAIGLRPRMLRDGQIREAIAASVGWSFIRSQAFVREPPCVVCSVIPICGSCASNGAQKNGLRLLRAGPGAGGTIGGYVGFATCRARDFGLFWNS